MSAWGRALPFPFPPPETGAKTRVIAIVFPPPPPPRGRDPDGDGGARRRFASGVQAAAAAATGSNGPGRLSDVGPTASRRATRPGPRIQRNPCWTRGLPRDDSGIQSSVSFWTSPGMIPLRRLSAPVSITTVDVRPFSWPSQVTAASGAESPRHMPPSSPPSGNLPDPRADIPGRLFDRRRHGIVAVGRFGRCAAPAPDQVVAFAAFAGCHRHRSHFPRGSATRADCIRGIS